MARRIGLNWLVGLALANGCAGEDDDAATTVATTPGGTNGSATAPADDGTDDGDDDDGVDDGPATVDDGPDTSPSDTGADDDPTVTSGPVDSDDDGPIDTGEVDTGPGEEGPAEAGDDGPLQMCLDMAETECEDCACTNCLAEVQACQMDPGCVEIRMCAQENMCTGIECLGPCGAVIDANGGAFGESAGLASALSDCYEGACPNC